MGISGTDIVLSKMARKIFPFSIECKATRASPTRKTLKQATKNAYPDTLPVVCWKPHMGEYKDAFILMSFNEFIKLWKEVYDKENLIKEVSESPIPEDSAMGHRDEQS